MAWIPAALAEVGKATLNVVYNLDKSDVSYHFAFMKQHPQSQHAKTVQLLNDRKIARLREFKTAGITAATIARMERAGELVRLGRGIYQLPGTPTDANHDLAIVVKAIPSGVICLVSALAYHELTDIIPTRVWIAIGPKDRKPNLAHPSLQVVRFSDKHLGRHVKEHTIDGVPVTITTVARTIVDLFRYRQSAGRRFKTSPGLNIALEGLREALDKRKVTPAEIARCADEAGIWKVVRPYLEAMTVNA